MNSPEWLGMSGMILFGNTITAIDPINTTVFNQSLLVFGFLASLGVAVFKRSNK